MSLNDTFPDFPHPAGAIKKYERTGSMFTLLLNSDEIHGFSPGDAGAFESWLTHHDIKNAWAEIQDLDLLY